MIRGLQSSTSGMIAQMAGQDITANNLANVNTAGFKRDVASFGAVLDGKLGAAQTSQIDPQVGNDFAQGTLKQTDNPLDVAISGDGFFSVQTGTGTSYTRDGSFTRSSDGTLTTQNGDKVMGNSGPIRLSDGPVKVDERGQVIQNGAVVDTLQVVQFANPGGLQKLGGNLWGAASGVNPTPATGTKVQQGYLEGSNVNPISEMVSMISGLRSYEASQKAVQAQDETLDKAVNDVGRV